MRKIINKWVCLNGDMVFKDNARISIMDRSCLYGDGLFETFRVYNGKIFALDEHLSRLIRGFNTLDFHNAPMKNFLRESLVSLCKINCMVNGSIRLTVTRGLMEEQLIPGENDSPCFFATCKEGISYDEDSYKKGVEAIISGIRRNEHSPLSGVKSVNFLDNLLAKMEAKKSGVMESILLNTRGDVSEGSVNNIFIVQGKNIITPHEKSGALPGITRGVLINLLSQDNSYRQHFNLDNSDFQCKTVKREQLFTASEVFLTNSLMEIMPVVRINEQRIGNGEPGDITKRVHHMYKSFVKENI